MDNFGELIENASLKYLNTYGIDTNARYLIYPQDIDKLIELLDYLKSNNIKYFIIGGGSNIILPDEDFDGAVISLKKINEVVIEGSKVVAGAGVSLGVLIKKCIVNNLKGLEYLTCIPGSLGGALLGNAGIKDHEIYDYIDSVDIIRDGKIIHYKKDDIAYSYRNTMFKDTEDIIVGATFQLDTGNKDEMEEIVEDIRRKRTNTQPLDYPSAGSVFKNPEGDYASRMIESLGLKGYYIGGAKISEKHANFIINFSNATSKNIKELIDYIKLRVKEKYDIDLELEQRIINW